MHELKEAALNTKAAIRHFGKAKYTILPAFDLTWVAVVLK